MTEPTPKKKHPAQQAWEEFLRAHPEHLNGRAEGLYLENRLRYAFSIGWDACERAVLKALGRTEL